MVLVIIKLIMSENPISADNQQESSKTYLRGYIVGLVDGEGTFHVAFAKRVDLTLGVAVIPEFHISQNVGSKSVLQLAQKILGCGYLKPNHRNSLDKTWVLVVRDKMDLATKVIPFFKINQLKTTKNNDFQIFAKITEMVISGFHRDYKGLLKIISLAYQMNGNGSRRKRSQNELIRLLKSSETIRRTRLIGGKI